MVMPNLIHKKGKIKQVRIAIKRGLFKSFTVLQVRREQLLVSPWEPYSESIAGLYEWEEINPNNAHEIQEAMNLLETLNVKD